MLIQQASFKRIWPIAGSPASKNVPHRTVVHLALLLSLMFANLPLTKLQQSFIARLVLENRCQPERRNLLESDGSFFFNFFQHNLLDHCHVVKTAGQIHALFSGLYGSA
ncbi:hypothetical protein ACNR9V_16050 [Parageobacillus thermoglucosidasius]|uniref:hypothetical protein n=1 Tax=Parageobacillus thermoglucosidasius TaxID=1426 RepID=UPI003B681C12